MNVQICAKLCKIWKLWKCEQLCKLYKPYKMPWSGWPGLPDWPGLLPVDFSVHSLKLLLTGQENLSRFQRCYCIWKFIITSTENGCALAGLVAFFLSQVTILSLSYVPILSTKVKLLNSQFNFNCWMKWMFCKYSIVWYFWTLDLLTSCHI